MENLLLLILLILLLLTAVVIYGGFVMSNNRKDLLRTCRFRVEIDGIEQTGACEVSGLEALVEIIEYREGTDPLHSRNLSGLTKYGTLTVKYGLTDSMEIYNWFKSGVEGDVQPRQVSVVAMDMQGREKARWDLVEAWPSKYQAPAFNAKANDIAMETIEIVCEGISRVN